MESKQSTTGYRVSVLLELSGTPELVLHNAVQLTKQMEGSLEVFHVKSANQTTSEALAEIKYLIDRTVRSGEDLTIEYRLEHGNVRHRIRDYLAMEKPDVLVMGRRKNTIGLLGPSITNFVIDHTNATNIFIFDGDERLRPFDDMNFGVFGSNLNEKGKELIMRLKRESQHPVRLFDINDQAGESVLGDYPWPDTIPYIFTQSATALDALISYVNRTKTELLCIPKGPNRTFPFQTNPIRRVLNKSNVPLMILA